MISIIPAKTLQKFEDPFKYIEPKATDEEGEEAAAAAPEESKTHEQSQNIEIVHTYLLGSVHKKDSDGGDAGSLPKKSKHYPYVDFIRSQFCGKYQNSILHSDVSTVGGSQKMMRDFHVTTGIVLAYKNTFDVDVYSI